MKLAPGLDHLAQQLSAVQRCAYLAPMTAPNVQWPLDVPTLDEHRLNVDWFEPLAAFNERFTQWQDAMGATLRHTADLLAEPTEPYLRVLVFFEKQGGNTHCRVLSRPVQDAQRSGTSLRPEPRGRCGSLQRFERPVAHLVDVHLTAGLLLQKPKPLCIGRYRVIGQASDNAGWRDSEDS